jgi:hypothetical protein
MNDLFQSLSADWSSMSPMLQPKIPSRFECADKPADAQHASDELGLPKDAPAPVEVQPLRRLDDLPSLARTELAPGTASPILDRGALASGINFPQPTLPSRPILIPNPFRPPERDDPAAGAPEMSVLLARIETIGQSLRGSQAIRERVPSNPVHACQPACNERDTPPSARTNSESLRATGLSDQTVPASPPRIIPERMPSLSPPISAGPTVNVTIGRIEVKAHKEPAPMRSRPESSSRVMSLDQYLQRRAGGTGL